jgi:hypothetical protein
MPRTKFQEYVFTFIMVFFMVYTMTFYNAALEGGCHYSTFLQALTSMWPEYIAAFIVQKYFVGPLVKKNVAKFFIPGKDKPIFIIATTAFFTVSMMAPAMTLIVSILHIGFTDDLVVSWLPKLVLNLPFALFAQLLYIGPLVRFIFRTLFKKQLSLSPNLVAVGVPGSSSFSAGLKGE